MSPPGFTGAESHYCGINQHEGSAPSAGRVPAGLRGRPSLVCTSVDGPNTARVCKISVMLNFIASTLMDTMKEVRSDLLSASLTAYWLISQVTSRLLQSACSSTSTFGIPGDEAVAEGRGEKVPHKILAP